jgi:hypothetical protein
VAYDSDTSYGEADAYVWWDVGSLYGQYGIRGDHYYVIEDDYLYGGNFLQSTYWSVDASGPPANITNITWSPADSAWQAGYSYTFIVTGTGFGSNPNVTIMGPDNTNYYNASCTQGTQCDTYISGTVSIPSSAPSGDAMVIVTPVGFAGLGFGQNPPSPPPVTGEVPVTAAEPAPLWGPAYIWDASVGVTNTACEYGFQIGIAYQAYDQWNGHWMYPGQQAYESITSASWHQDGYPPQSLPDIPWSPTLSKTDSNGQFSDAPLGYCGAVAGTYTAMQSIGFYVNGVWWTVRTNSLYIRGAGPGQGRVSNGVDVTVTQ